MDIKTSFAKEALTLAPIGRIDSSNAGEFQVAIDNAFTSYPTYESVLVDLQKVEYVSSAALRVFLGLNKRLVSEEKKLTLANASPALMEIFQMTGFSEILDIRPPFKDFDVTNLPVIGSGMCGDVYKVNDETILKLYKSNMDLAMILKEKENAKRAFVLGVPTPISYDLVKVGDRIGILFEMLHAKDLISLMKNDLDHIPDYAVMFARLAKLIHGIDGKNSRLPRKTDDYWDFFKRTNWLTPSEHEEVEAMLKGLPEATTIVHGDFHPGNTMLSDNELMFIDMGDVSIGSPYNDLCQVYCFYKMDEPAELIAHITKIDTPHRRVFYQAFMDEYFDHPSPDKLTAIEETIKDFVAVREMIYAINFPEGAPLDQKILRDRLAERRAKKH
jgi:uncharacterized protein (TIGR02172 family)